MKRIEPEKGRAGRTRSRRVLAVVLLAVFLLVAALAVLNLVVSSRARSLQQSIAADRVETAEAAHRAAAGFERYLAGGARGDLILDGPALTRFVDLRYGSGVPHSVEAWRISLRDGRAVVEGVVELQSYLLEMGMEQPASLRGLSGQVPFSFRGRLEAGQGRGCLTVEEVTLLGLPLPLDLVERVAGTAGRGEGSVLIQRFNLPEGISRAEIEKDRMVIHGSGP